MRTSLVTVLGLALASALLACGGKHGAAQPGDRKPDLDTMMGQATSLSADAASSFGPLDVGADWSSYVKMNTSPVQSEPHGGRLVDTWVNATGAAVYLDDDAEIPVGTIVVKTSTDVSGAAGPLFVMEKRAAGFDPDHGDWYYAMHWAEPPPSWQKKLGGPVYWRTPSKKVGYCSDCHDGFDRSLGGVPPAQRRGQAPGS